MGVGGRHGDRRHPVQGNKIGGTAATRTGTVYLDAAGHLRRPSEEQRDDCSATARPVQRANCVQHMAQWLHDELMDSQTGTTAARLARRGPARGGRVRECCCGGGTRACPAVEPGRATDARCAVPPDVQRGTLDFPLTLWPSLPMVLPSVCPLVLPSVCPRGIHGNSSPQNASLCGRVGPDN